MTDDDFKPRPGKIRARGSKETKRYGHRLLTAINRAGGRKPHKPGASLSHIGRGGVAAASLASRDRFAGFRQRRVIVKARIVKLAGKGMAAARAHLRYIQRDGVTREGERGQIYDAGQDRTDGKAFLERSNGDRHQFRFIVAPEDGIEYDELKPLTRRLMAQMGADLDTRLDWVAVDHFNTGHPHTHIILRGKDDKGRDLVIARDYIATGIRERAAELVSLDLGPRTDRDIEERLRAEMGEDRFTSLDRQLLRLADEERIVTSASQKIANRDACRQTLLAGRLKRLERMGLAEELCPGHWRLADRLEDTLRRLGERYDILKTMHREMAAKNLARSPADYALHDAAHNATDPRTNPIVGRVVARGLCDEHNDRHYLIIDGTDGRAHYIDIGKGEATGPTPDGSIVRVTPKSLAPRKADRAIAEVAARHGGRYTIDRHLKHDPSATETFAETHVRRLEAIRRATGGVTREPDGAWVIAPDHLDRVVEYERQKARAAPVIVETLCHLTLDQQTGADGATWLDRELVSDSPERLRDSGFGREARQAQARRRQWLIEQGLAQAEQDRTLYRANMLATLRRRELTRIARQLSDQHGLPYVETCPGEPVEGRLARAIDLASGKYAVIEQSHEFTLVPWRPVLERHIGQQVSGIAHGNGISWTIGRQRRGLGVS